MKNNLNMNVKKVGTYAVVSLFMGAQVSLAVLAGSSAFAKSNDSKTATIQDSDMDRSQNEDGQSIDRIDSSSNSKGQERVTVMNNGREIEVAKPAAQNANAFQSDGQNDEDQNEEEDDRNGGAQGGDEGSDQHRGSQGSNNVGSQTGGGQNGGSQGENGGSGQNSRGQNGNGNGQNGGGQVGSNVDSQVGNSQSNEKKEDHQNKDNTNGGQPRKDHRSGNNQNGGDQEGSNKHKR